MGDEGVKGRAMDNDGDVDEVGNGGDGRCRVGDGGCSECDGAETGMEATGTTSSVSLLTVTADMAELGVEMRRGRLADGRGG